MSKYLFDLSMFIKKPSIKFKDIGFKSSLGRLVLSGAARRIAITLVQLFSPVYIYISLTDKDISKAHSILFVLTFYFLTFLVKVTTQIISEDLSRKVGFKEVIRFSLPPFLFFILFLIFASEIPLLFLIAAIFSGVHMGLFWWGYHGYFVKKAQRKHYGRSVGQANLLETAASIITPVLGALTTSYLGFPILFIFSAVFMSISLLLLGPGSKTRQFHDVKFFDVVATIKSHKSISLAYIGMGGEAVISAIVWPMFLFLFFGKLISLGMIVTLSALIASAFSVAAGAWADKMGERKIISYGIPVLFSSWIIRYVSLTFLSFVFADSLRNFGRSMIAMPLSALSYKKAHEGGTAKAILFLEVTQTIGVLMTLFLVSLLVLIQPDLSLSFVVAALLSILPTIAVVKKRFYSLNE